MTTARQVAGKLSKAQREFLLELPARAVPSYPPRQKLLDLGLAIVVRPPDGALHRTSLGEEVRRILKEGKDG